MVDIHCHILYDIDDGAKTLDESVKMCRDAYQNGYKAVVATPHFTDGCHYIDSFVRERNYKASRLREELKDEGIPLVVATGAELYLNDDIFAADGLDKLTINNSRYMLCEFPLGPFDLEQAPLWIGQLVSYGYIPILAHPERYMEFYRYPPIIDDVLDRGALFQVNIDSILGFNGEPAQQMAIDMVQRRIALFIGSDAHDPVHRHNKFKEKLNHIPRDITNEMLIECMSNMPRKVLKNKDIY